MSCPRGPRAPGCTTRPGNAVRSPDGRSRGGRRRGPRAARGGPGPGDPPVRRARGRAGRRGGGGELRRRRGHRRAGEGPQGPQVGLQARARPQGPEARDRRLALLPGRRARPRPPLMRDIRVEARPVWPFRLPAFGGRDATMVARGPVLHRLVHVGDEPAVVRVRQLAPDRVLFGAEATQRDVAEEAIARMRFALAVDDDLSPFYERFRDDPLIGPAVRARPWLRIGRRPDPFEALAWAVTEQLIESTRAAEIQRRIVVRLGRRCPRTGLRDLPAPEALAGAAPALLQSFDLSAGRAVALIRCAREVARGRVDLRDGDHERGWRRLRAIPGIGAWTVECLALHGQGRYDQLPAGDLAWVKLVGRVTTGEPYARATEDEVRAFFAPYGAWAALAAKHAITIPHPAGTRWSAPAATLAA